MTNIDPSLVARAIDVDAGDALFSKNWERIQGLEIDPRVLERLDDKVVRSHRMLVPIDVQALVASAEVGDRGDVRVQGFDPDATGSGGQRRRMPFAFTSAKGLPTGVHLHWAMPDSLTHADPEVDGTSERDPGFRPLPNRWLVVRMMPALRRSVRRPIKAWIVESERARSVELDDWKPDAEFTPPDGHPPVVSPTDLTAVMGGDPGWAAVYDNVVNRFAFHDDLADIGDKQHTVTYAVMGWYSDPKLDPLHVASALRAHDYGWSVDGSTGWSAGIKAEARADEIDGLLAGTGRTVTRADAIEGAPFGRREVDLATTVESVIVSDRLQKVRATMYHGVVLSVPVNARRFSDGRPAANRVSLAAAHSMSDGVAKLLSDGDLDQERLLAAFGHGMIDLYDEGDGFASVDAGIHQRSFVTFPDPDGVIERVRVSPPVSRPGATEPPVGSGGGLFESPTGKFDLASAGGGPSEDAITLMFAESRSSAMSLALARLVDKVPADDPGVRFESIRRPGPRYWYPNDPVLCVRGLNRSQRHGSDGRFDPDEQLGCRLTGQPIRAYGDLVVGAHLHAQIVHGGVPFEVNQVLAEAALLEPTQVGSMARAVDSTLRLGTEAVEARLEAEMTLGLYLRTQTGDAAELLNASMRDGIEPSPVGVTHWTRQPWIPIYLEWEINVADTDRLTGWDLSDIDLTPADADAIRLDPEFSSIGRSLLASAGAKSLSDSIDKFLDQEDKFASADDGVLDAAQERDLADLAVRASAADLLVGGMNGLNDLYLGIDDDDLADSDSELSPTAVPQLLRAGVLEVTRLRVVDAFGRTLDLGSRLSSMQIAEPAAVTDRPAADGPAIELPPRFTSPSRLLFRFLDAADDDREARVDQETPLLDGNPIAGFLLPDHADDAVEFFDASGQPVGQLFHSGLRSEVTWEGVPGTPGPIGAPPPSGDDAGALNHLSRLAVSLVERDAIERSSPADDPLESPLRALLRTIDTTLWTVDPFGSTGLEHVSLLTGRPIAVVRARLRFDVYDDSDDYDLGGEAIKLRRAEFDKLLDRAFDVRLGSLTRFDDGLLGYFVNDDYGTFHPVHASVRQHARPAGPQVGFLDGLEEAAAFGADFDADESIETIDQPFVADASAITLRPGQTIHLTLLMHPGAGVHATCGLVPRKRLELARSWLAEPLARIMPSFRVGPVMVDPEAIRMPRVSALPEAQSWARRDTTTSWRDDPILAAASVARLSDRPAVAQEGWVRARPDEAGG